MEKILLGISAALCAVSFTLLCLILKNVRKKTAQTGTGADPETQRTLHDLAAYVRYGNEATVKAVERLSEMQKERLSDVERRMADSSRATETRLEQVRKSIDDGLKYVGDVNARQLAEMRGVVDEKLSTTLETRLSKSFELISARLEAVYKGIGEVNSLAESVSDIKKIFTNVKLRGTWGETQLETLLAQMLSPAQYAKQVAIDPLSAERVDFAVFIPSKDGRATLLPIDSKFPIEEYNRLLEADDGDRTARQKAERGLLTRVKQEAESIAKKYIRPPETTDFALMYLPGEGLYGEVVKNDDLMEHLMKIRVMAAGPGTLGAMLMSLQAGFKSIAIERRSAELWQLLAAFKGEFARFSDLLVKMQKKLSEAQDTIDSAAKKTRAIEKKLSGVDVLPFSATDALDEESYGLQAGETDEEKSESDGL